MSRKFETEIEIAAPPEAVWKAISEAEGIQSWFAPEARVTPGVGGSFWVSWGPGMEGESRIEIWEPNRHQRHASPRPNGAEPNVVEYTIESKDGSHTTLRLVNSGFGADANFDNELESTSHAWPLFLLLMKHGIEQRYTRCRNVTVFKTFEMPHDQVWKQLSAKFGTPGELRHFDPFGNACYELTGMNRSMLAIFCERCGGVTALTVMAVLYDLSPDQEQIARTLAEKVANSVEQSVDAAVK